MDNSVDNLWITIDGSGAENIDNMCFCSWSAYAIDDPARWCSDIDVTYSIKSGGVARESIGCRNVGQSEII